jgi:hypothetical protein
MVMSKKEAGADAHHHVEEEEEAGDDDASNTNIYLNMSDDRIEKSDVGANQQTENVYISNISFFYMYIYETK